VADLVETPLIVLCGPTASGKTALALALADAFSGEIVSCDSVAVYRGMEIGTAKPFTAGDYSRLAREAIAGITQRARTPIVAGGTGLYLRALLDGLFPAPQRDEPLREKLRHRSGKNPAQLHRILTRLDPAAAAKIHANDMPKLIRAIEVTLAARQPITEQWEQPRNALTGHRVLRLGLNPAREALYERINRRAAEMFDRGLVEETTQLVEYYGFDCRPLTSLGYMQSVQVLRGEITHDAAVAATAQGHRNYAKRQLTWFRKDTAIHWLGGFGSDSEMQSEAVALVGKHLRG
jgi:tRNA dimethylallyltransferase